MKIIDISRPMRIPSPMKAKIEHKLYRKSTWLLRLLGLPFKLFHKDLSGREGDAIQKKGMHSSALVDASWRYYPMTKGDSHKTVDDIPLEWCFGKGIVIDMKHKANFDPVTVADIEAFLVENKLTLQPGMIVLIKTGRDRYYGTKDLHKTATGMSVEATEWLVDKGIRVIGIDSRGWDLQLPSMEENTKGGEYPEHFSGVHLVGKSKEYCHMEQLMNLDELPCKGFRIAVFPQKIVGATAAPARVVALVG